MRAPSSLAACLLLVVAGCGASAVPSSSPVPHSAGSAAPIAATPGTPAATPQPDGPVLGQTFGLVYDPGLERIVLVNGAIEGGASRPTELWSWDGVTWEPISLEGPPARSFGVVARDRERGVIVVHGGETSDGRALNETLEWSGTEWTAHAWDGEGPGARGGAGLAWDEAGQRLLLFGGGTDGAMQADTWAWDGTTWTQVAATGPSPRFVSLMTDTRLGGILLQGGHWVRGDDGGFLPDTWSWDGTEWQLVAEDGDPGSRVNAPGVWDPTREGVVMFGGGRGVTGTPANDTWLWDGEWTPVEVPTSPSARNGHAIAFDEARGVTVLVGGVDRPGGRQVLDVWELDADGWREVFPVR